MSDEYMTKTTDPVARANLFCIKDLIEVAKKTNDLALANSIQNGLNFTERFYKISDILWELTHEVSDLLVYEEVKNGH